MYFEALGDRGDPVRKKQQRILHMAIADYSESDVQRTDRRFRWVGGSTLYWQLTLAAVPVESREVQTAAIQDFRCCIKYGDPGGAGTSKRSRLSSKGKSPHEISDFGRSNQNAIPQRPRATALQRGLPIFDPSIPLDQAIKGTERRNYMDQHMHWLSHAPGSRIGMKKTSRQDSRI
jgi:hypothetical protein